MQAGHPSLIVTPVEGVVAGPDRLYVGAGHRLVPQPHGFEGFAQIVVDRPASDLAALDLVEHCEAVLPLDPASLPTPRWVLITNTRSPRSRVSSTSSRHPSQVPSHWMRIAVSSWWPWPIRPSTRWLASITTSGSK